MHSTTHHQPHHSIPLFTPFKPSPISHGCLTLDLDRSSLIPFGPPTPWPPHTSPPCPPLTYQVLAPTKGFGVSPQGGELSWVSVWEGGVGQGLQGFWGPTPFHSLLRAQGAPKHKGIKDFYLRPLKPYDPHKLPRPQGVSTRSGRGVGGEPCVWASWRAQGSSSLLAPHVPSPQVTPLMPSWRPCQGVGEGKGGGEGSQGVWECPHATHPCHPSPPMELAPPSAWASKGDKGHGHHTPSA